MAMDNRLYALVQYEDQYVQPLLLSALRRHVPSELLVLIQDISELPSPSSKFLQWRQYESVDWEQVMNHPTTTLANSFIIRKALIRKHYLSTTVSHWLAKHPSSCLKDHVKPSVEFEVDYSEFLDDALVEAYELKESWARNDALSGDSESREWWILKPGMSDRGQGIRLFSSEEELTGIFEAWDPPSDDDEDEYMEARGDARVHSENGVMASHLRHFVAQPYVHPPLLVPSPHASCHRKFHIRTYVLAVGALQVYVYRPMLALFASKVYSKPGPDEELSRHLTNTCLQSGQKEGSVHAFWSLPSTISGFEKNDWREEVFQQICNITSETFEAAARAMSVHFQPLPNAFELFGLDFLVDAEGVASMLEVNAFPDFAQTGHELQSIISTLFDKTVKIAVNPFVGLSSCESLNDDEMPRVLDIDLGRR